MVVWNVFKSIQLLNRNMHSQKGASRQHTGLQADIFVSKICRLGTPMVQAFLIPINLANSSSLKIRPKSSRTCRSKFNQVNVSESVRIPPTICFDLRLSLTFKVGRTGAGKSSIALALLRAIKTTGKVYYDGIATDTINLDALRSNITLIPQQPELIHGTLRENLDPFEQHDDTALYDALRAAGLFSLQSEADENRLTLDGDIASGGGDLSVGQRQILALARAIVRQSKLLILDEGTLESGILIR